MNIIIMLIVGGLIGLFAASLSLLGIIVNVPLLAVTPFIGGAGLAVAAAVLAAWKLGAIIAPLNPVYTEEELSTLLASSGAKVVVVLTRYYERVKTYQPRTAVKMSGDAFYSVHNDTDAEAELLIFSTRLAEPRTEKQDDFWPG